MSDRIAGLLFAALAAWAFVTAGSFEAGFSDPVGPAAFPRLLAVPLGILSLFLILRPDPNPRWAVGRPLLRQALAVAVLGGYALLLETLGFPVATLLGVTFLARLLGARWLPALATGAALSLVLFVLFDQVLDLPLPLWPQTVG
ncbi:tripartite tricarboxylate transporter TctB family protein (plasmid) [Skermanella mucosa]|uniref:tripartite tricarboxylate transporter TctB family protein n=1 Tax=Skermanella mucosa TaxID=1789672 RepID=UPI00192C7D20|nr:tripartite tricarboxylate transporter TctB family protein [Skermanella mucosa]UEM24252.1 tripartite tricarboxylate transporter TctB family protein [Skermanella mucosa]